MAMPDDPLERRRVQNRMAQRRFRFRQNQRNAIELVGQVQNAAASLYLEAVNLDGRLDDFSLPTNDGSSIPVDFSASLSCVGSLSETFSLLDSHNRHDHFTGVDANGNCIPYAISEPVHSTLSTSPSNSTTLDILGSGRMQDRNTSPAQSENLHYVSEEKSLESAIMATTDLIKTSNFSSPDRSSAGAPLDQPSAGTSPGTSDESGINNPGWLSALHMAARRGHGGIVRLLLQHCMDTNERDSDGLTPLMHAVAGGHEEVVNLLLAHGARLGDVDGRRRSVLHWAVLTYREGLLRLLLKHAATDDPLLIDGYDETGRTPLHTAIDSGFETGVSILVEFGVNLHSRARKP
ncbi:ankyrin repeat domain-containing 27 [Trichoderma arundinaceum]|uniref:Ankyrin repeat domain-containing 27 n=1 Tax=Trichoderma arundinaceum TaxID=490622 RepID=A0A395NQ47_TRIAR|nr:ankyrin repeat domain-containing 27 [Trichoderma arundinaceum]